MMDGSIMYTCIAYIIRDIFPRNEVFERGDKVVEKMVTATACIWRALYNYYWASLATLYPLWAHFHLHQTLSFHNKPCPNVSHETRHSSQIKQKRENKKKTLRIFNIFLNNSFLQFTLILDLLLLTRFNKILKNSVCVLSTFFYTPVFLIIRSSYVHIFRNLMFDVFLNEYKHCIKRTL